MKTPPTVSRQDWDAARDEMLVKEKALLRRTRPPAPRRTL